MLSLILFMQRFPHFELILEPLKIIESRNGFGPGTTYLYAPLILHSGRTNNLHPHVFTVKKPSLVARPLHLSGVQLMLGKKLSRHLKYGIYVLGDALALVV